MSYKRLLDLRELRGWTQKEVAGYLHVAQNTYSQYETGKVSPSVAVFAKLACLYETSMDYLAGLTDVPVPYPPAAKNRRLPR